MEQNLIQSKKLSPIDRSYYDIFFQQTSLGVVVLACDLSILDANKVYLNSVKKNKEDILGKKCYEVIKGFHVPCPSENSKYGCPVAKSLKTGKTAQTIHEHTLANGKPVYFSITSYPIKDLNKQVSHIIELWQDITPEITEKWENKVKKIHSDIKQVIQEDRLVALGKLVASSVHEINNPIQGMLTFSYIIKDIVQKVSLDKNDLLQVREFNSHITRELLRCGDIVSGLLAFSRETALEFVNIDINEILAAVISLTGHKLKLSNIQLATSFCKSPLIVNGDHNQLQQCFLNIIFNAIEAMPNGGKISIKSGIEKDNKTIFVEISDNGCGITNKDMEYIFDPFYTTKENGGTGLGLSIVYGIIKDHKGDVRVESCSGTRTSFIILLPHIVPT